MQLNSRVTVLSAAGRFVLAVHRERAQAMLICGEATYESPGRLRLSGAVKQSLEAAPKHYAPKPRRADSSHGDAGRGLVSVRRVLHIGVNNGASACL
jgi:hypothetical protein